MAHKEYMKYSDLVQSLTCVTNGFFGVLVMMFFPILLDRIGVYVMLIFGGYTVFAALVIYFYMPEIKGKGSEEIYREIRDKQLK